jgi:hypothetical protein
MKCERHVRVHLFWHLFPQAGHNNQADSIEDRSENVDFVDLQTFPRSLDPARPH